MRSLDWLDTAALTASGPMAIALNNLVRLRLPLAVWYQTRTMLLRVMAMNPGVAKSGCHMHADAAGLNLRA